MDLATVDELLTTTRTVRRRLDLERPVDPAVVIECLRLAVQAPSGSNSQPWHWVVVTDGELRSRLAELYRRGGQEYVSQALRKARADGDRQQERVLSSAQHLLDVIDRVPVHVIPCIEGRLTSVADAAGFWGSILPAVWSFQLALRSRGLGSAWTTFHLRHEADAAALLGIPPNVTQVALLAVAYTVGTTFSPARRRPVEYVTYWNQWGVTDPHASPTVNVPRSAGW